MISPNEIIGSLVYRTREALNKNQKFLDGLKDFDFYDCVTENGRLKFWHYPYTFEEISETYLALNDRETGKFKFPALFNFQSVREEIAKEGLRILNYNLIFAGPVNRAWTTETREAETWKKLLSPLYLEFFAQAERLRFLKRAPGPIPHVLYRIPTTGTSATAVLSKRYSDYMDAWQVSLRLTVLPMCDRELETITKENKQVNG